MRTIPCPVAGLMTANWVAPSLHSEPTREKGLMRDFSLIVLARTSLMFDGMMIDCVVISAVVLFLVGIIAYVAQLCT